MLFLDTQSSITYPEVLKQESFIKINGSVYIKDEHNKLNIVRLSAGEIEVIPERATFYISYDSAIETSEVHVQSGAVIIKHGQKQIKLEAGEAVRFGKTKNEMGEKIPFNINLYSYVTKVFDFRDTPLKEAIQSLEKGYGVTIKLNNPAMNNCRITTLLDNKTLRQVLDIMAFTLNFEYDYSEADGVVLLSGKGCD